MKAAGWGLLLATLGGLVPLAGCYVPKSQLVNYETTNRVLAEQNRRSSWKSRTSRRTTARSRTN